MCRVSFVRGAHRYSPHHLCQPQVPLGTASSSRCPQDCWHRGSHGQFSHAWDGWGPLCQPCSDPQYPPVQPPEQGRDSGTGRDDDTCVTGRDMGMGRDGGTDRMARDSVTGRVDRARAGQAGTLAQVVMVARAAQTLPSCHSSTRQQCGRWAPQVCHASSAQSTSLSPAIIVTLMLLEH